MENEEEIKVSASKSRIVLLALFIGLVAFVFLFASNIESITGRFTANNGIRVGITYLVDENCANCYNVLIHKQILTEYGLNLQEKTVEVNSEEGKALIEKYKIDNAPAYILDDRATKSDIVMTVWPEVGTLEEDGKLIFRNNYVLGVPYERLSDGQWIEVTNSQE